MLTEPFLSSVLPDDGEYCIAAIKDGKTQHFFYDNIKAAVERVEELNAQKKNVYFNTSALVKGSRRRTQENAQSEKALFVDLDCGESKDYPDKASALTALRAFCVKVGMPVPTLVDSGNGVHAYWPFTESVSKELWQSTATQLKALAAREEFTIDPAVTADSARLMRVPGSFNVKTEDPLPCKVIKVGSPKEHDFYVKLFEDLGIKPEIPREHKGVNRHVKSSKATMALAGNSQTIFKQLAQKSLKGTGCNFVKKAIVEQATLEEPLWRAALSLAWVCVDADSAIQKISSKHPEYSPERTIEKASLTAGPYTCKTIRGLDAQACEGCPHTLTSPIQLANKTVRTPPEEVQRIWDVVPQEEEEVPLVNESGEPDIKEDIKLSFNPPKGYFVAKNGAIHVEFKDENGDPDDRPIYENTLFLADRIMDPNDGECVLCKLAMPLGVEGTREFRIPLSDLGSNDKVKTLLGAKGVAANKKQWNDIVEYLIKFVKDLQKTKVVKDATLQYGWSKDYKRFIVGDRAYSSTSYVHNPESSTTANSIGNYAPTGSLAEWTKMTDAFNVRGAEAQQFVVCCGFGAPLLAHSGMQGAMINLLGESGGGKTSAAYLALGVFGNPKKTILTSEDTQNAIYHRMGVSNNLFTSIDEISNWSEERLSAILYAITHGRGRERMLSSANDLRQNLTTWCTILMTSSNAPVANKLANLKSRPDGELMRLVEINVPKIYIEEAENIIRDGDVHFGTAGEVYAPWLVKNIAHLPKLIDRQRDILKRRLGHDQAERFRVGTVAAALCGGHVAKSLGLINYDMDAITDWAVKELNRMRDVTNDNISCGDSFMGEFVLANSSSILPVYTTANGKPFVQLNGKMPNKVVGRFEVDTGKLIVAKNYMREYCVRRSYSMAEVLTSVDPNSPYKYVGQSKTRLLAHTDLSMSPPVNSLIFVCDDNEREALKRSVFKDESDD